MPPAASTTTEGDAGHPPLPSTFAEAERLSPYKLAQIWGNVFTWPVLANRTRRQVLEELAVMAALASWLRRWLPLQVHRAAVAGASLDQALSGQAPAAAGTEVLDTATAALCARAGARCAEVLRSALLAVVVPEIRQQAAQVLAEWDAIGSSTDDTEMGRPR